MRKNIHFGILYIPESQKKIKEIPPSIGEEEELLGIYLPNHRFKLLPKELNNAPNLKFIYVPDCRIQEFPKFLLNNPKVRSLKEALNSIKSAKTKAIEAQQYEMAANFRDLEAKYWRLQEENENDWAVVLSGNPIQDIPAERLMEGYSSIVDFFDNAS